MSEVEIIEGKAHHVFEIDNTCSESSVERIVGCDCHPRNYRPHMVEDGFECVLCDAVKLRSDSKMADSILLAMTDLYDNATDTVWITPTETMFDRLSELYLSAGGNAGKLAERWPEVF